MKHSSLLSVIVATVSLSRKCKSQSNPLKTKNIRRKIAEIACGEIQDEYTPTDITSIGIETANQKVMVSHYIKNDKEMATCTAQMCILPCCKSCGTSPKFENIYLTPSRGDMFMGCGGSNCDYMDNCVYEDGDKVLVYGTVDSFGWTIKVDQHCIDPNYTLKEGDDVKNDDNTTHDGKEDDFFILKSNEDTPDEEEEKCQELSSEFMLPGTTYCMRMLGIGIWNGECKYISGCSENGHEFFSSMQECKITCSSNDFSIKEQQSPSLSIAPPNVTSHYIPYEGIRTCIKNTLYKTIYLPGCSVFTLLADNGTVSYPQRQCIYEGGTNEENAVQELLPGEEYCSNYESHFHEAGNYTLSAQYCRSVNKNDATTATPVFNEACREVYTIETELLEVSCPKMVDCMPNVAQPLWLVCAYSRDLFVEECKNTQILY